MTNEKLLIFGASGHARVVGDAVAAAGEFRVAAFVDHPSSELKELAGLPVLTDATWQDAKVVCGVLALGDNAAREALFSRLRSSEPKLSFSSIVHPSAVVSENAQIGEGTVVLAGAVINSGAVIGRHCIVNTGAIVEHDCVLEDFASLAPRATLGGGARVGARSAICISATVLHERKIGEDVVIGAGAVVTRDVQPCRLAYGVPSRVIRERSRAEPYL